MGREVSDLRFQLDSSVDSINRFMSEDAELFEIYRSIEGVFFKHFLNSPLAQCKVHEVPFRLFWRALSLWQASIKIAVCGQPYAFHPLIRVVIEYACYASFMQSKQTAIPVWIHREDNNAGRNKFNGVFGGVIKKTCDNLEERIPGLGRPIYKTYLNSMSDGAHPNPDAFTGRPMMAVQNENFIFFNKEADHFSIASLPTRKALHRALDVGLFLVTMANSSYRSISELPLEELRRIRDFAVSFAMAINEKIDRDTAASQEFFDSMRRGFSDGSAQ